MFRRTLVLALCGAALLAGPARAQAPDTAIEAMKKRGTMMVGMATFVPWAMRDAQGNLVGFEIDVATKLAKDLDLKLELVPTAWDGIIPALIAGKFDVIIGGMTITTKRNLTVNFSAPYDWAGSSLAIAKAHRTRLHPRHAERPAQVHHRLPPRQHRRAPTPPNTSRRRRCASSTTRRPSCRRS